VSSEDGSSNCKVTFKRNILEVTPRASNEIDCSFSSSTVGNSYIPDIKYGPLLTEDRTSLEGYLPLQY